MEKIYLKYDNVRPAVECDYGFAKDMIFLGFLYPLKKGDLRHFVVVLALHISLCIIICILTNVPIIFKLLLSAIIIIISNILFSLNYNMIVIERLLKEGYYPMDYNSSDKLIKKGIYFKLQ